jgi:hypothetical protein
MIDFEAKKVLNCDNCNAFSIVFDRCFESKNKEILERVLPDDLKLSIAEKIENNLFSKVLMKPNILMMRLCLIWFIGVIFQVTFLCGLKGMSAFCC